MGDNQEAGIIDTGNDAGEGMAVMSQGKLTHGIQGWIRAFIRIYIRISTDSWLILVSVGNPLD